MSVADLKARIMDALNFMPKPLSMDDVLGVSVVVMQNYGGPLNEFNKWFELNGASLTENINRG